MKKSYLILKDNEKYLENVKILDEESLVFTAIWTKNKQKALEFKKKMQALDLVFHLDDKGVKLEEITPTDETNTKNNGSLETKDKIEKILLPVVVKK